MRGRSASKAGAASRLAIGALGPVLLAFAFGPGSVLAAARAPSGRQPPISAYLEEQGGASATPTSALAYLQLAERGVTLAHHAWHDAHRGWYDERLGDRARFPLATIWGITPL